MIHGYDHGFSRISIHNAFHANLFSDHDFLPPLPKIKKAVRSIPHGLNEKSRESFRSTHGVYQLNPILNDQLAAAGRFAHNKTNKN
jgi:hypothetical protein